MPPSDQNQKGNSPLDDSINRLETLIDETEEQSFPHQVPVFTPEGDDEKTSLTIPVLDEVVTGTNEIQAPIPGTAEQTVSEDQLLDLIDNLENRLTGVLESLVNTLKDELIVTISEELTAQLDNYLQNLESREQSGGTSESETDNSHLDGYRPYEE